MLQRPPSISILSATAPTTQRLRVIRVRPIDGRDILSSRGAKMSIVYRTHLVPTARLSDRHKAAFP